VPNDSRATKAQRQAAARARATELRRQQERSAQRHRFIAIGVAVFVVLVIVAAVGIVLNQGHHTSVQYASAAYGGPDSANSGLVRPDLSAVQAPGIANSTGGIPISANGVGKVGTGTTVLQVYFDLQCPVCADFDSINAADLTALAQEPGITVVYQPLAFLDNYSKDTRYSSRAANALMTVADQDPSHFTGFLTALFKNQPAENTAAKTDAQIAQVALGAGVPQSVVNRFTTTISGSYQLQDATGATTDNTGSWRTFSPWIAAATGYAATQPVFSSGVGTPTLVLNGTQIGAGGSDGVNWQSSGSLRSYVEKIASQAASQ